MRKTTDKKIDELVTRLEEVSNDKDFLFGICTILENDDNFDEMIDYLDKRSNLIKEDVFYKAFEIVGWKDIYE